MRVGVHEGPCLVVRANDRIDLFGTTVNLAAPLAAEAGDNQVVALAEVLGRAHVGATLAARAPAVTEVTTRLRGLRRPYALAVVGPG